MAVSCWYFTASALIRRISSSSCRAIARIRCSEVVVSLELDLTADIGFTERGLVANVFFTGGGAFGKETGLVAGVAFKALMFGIDILFALLFVTGAAL